MNHFQAVKLKEFRLLSENENKIRHYTKMEIGKKKALERKSKNQVLLTTIYRSPSFTNKEMEILSDNDRNTSVKYDNFNTITNSNIDVMKMRTSYREKVNKKLVKHVKERSEILNNISIGK